MIEGAGYMSIKWRLRLSYILMLIIPFILIMCVGLLLTQAIGYRDSFLISREMNPAEEVLRFSQRISAIINREILENPDKFSDSNFIGQLEKEIGIDNAGIIVRKNQQMVYLPELVSKAGIELNLMPFKAQPTGDTDIIDKQNHFIIMRLYDFYFSDGSEGSIFLAIDIGKIRSSITALKNGFIILSIIILIITNGIISILVYRSIIIPLRKLEAAANSIKEGNLDDSIEHTFKDEFGEVIESFEEMRKRLKESMQLQHQYEENRKILISNISHDLKTPITSIKGYVEGIRDGIADTPEKMEKYINTIYRKASEMDVLIDELFLFSKLDLNKYPFDFHDINIVEYIKDIVEEMRYEVEKQSAVIHLQYPDKKIFVRGDISNLRRVFSNIIENCMKYKGDKPLVIQVRIKDRIDDVLIEISDNGKGISSNALAYIFDRFYRADLSRNANTGGSGLGLAIVKKIIEEHGGMVWAESEVDVGTSIYFTLKKIQVVLNNL